MHKDRERFLGYGETVVSSCEAVIHVYCLMNYHYHLPLSTPEGNLSRIMRHINPEKSLRDDFSWRPKEVATGLEGIDKNLP